MWPAVFTIYRHLRALVWGTGSCDNSVLVAMGILCLLANFTSCMRFLSASAASKKRSSYVGARYSSKTQRYYKRSSPSISRMSRMQQTDPKYILNPSEGGGGERFFSLLRALGGGGGGWGPGPCRKIVSQVFKVGVVRRHHMCICWDDAWIHSAATIFYIFDQHLFVG